jgi:G3E family GTPase
MYQKNFGEFFDNQITYASCLILSHTKGLSQEKLDDAVARLRALNDKATIVTTDWDELTGSAIVEAMTQKNTLDDELASLLAEAQKESEEHEHHHHHDHEHEHDHHHDHDHEHEHEHEHHHDHEHEHEHEHHHDHDHDHEHHHHHADDVFTSWGAESAKKFTKEEITAALEALENEEKYGLILRAKGIVPATDGSWIHYDYIPGTPDVRTGAAGVTGRLCVIGSKINEKAISELFGVEEA